MLIHPFSWCFFPIILLYQNKFYSSLLLKLSSFYLCTFFTLFFTLPYVFHFVSLSKIFPFCPVQFLFFFFAFFSILFWIHPHSSLFFLYIHSTSFISFILNPISLVCKVLILHSSIFHSHGPNPPPPPPGQNVIFLLSFRLFLPLSWPQAFR